MSNRLELIVQSVFFEEFGKDLPNRINLSDIRELHGIIHERYHYIYRKPDLRRREIRNTVRKILRILSYNFVPPRRFYNSVTREYVKMTGDKAYYKLNNK